MIKIVLVQHKFKKFNYLKNNPQKTPTAVAENNVEQQRRSSASAVRGNNIKAPLRRQSKKRL